MKGGNTNTNTNRSNLNKNNIINPTFDTLMVEGHKAYKAYRVDHEELFLSRCEVTRQRTVLKDTTPIIIRKAEIIPEVWPNPPPSCNNVQSMINSALERQAKSTDELPYSICYRVPEFSKFSEEDDKTTLEHVGQFIL
jgi:hypothetical protein